MKAFLMYRDRDIDPAHELSASEQALVQDLELDTLWAAMAAGDDFLLGMARQTALYSLSSAEAITYRQHILADAIRQPDVVRQLYDLAVAAIVTERRAFFGLLSKSPDSVLYRSVQVLEMFTGVLKQLRAVADEHAGSFESEGFTRLFRMLAEELDDQYLQAVEDHLKELGFRKGTLISARLGQGNKGAGYVLRKLRDQGWRDRLAIGGQPGFSFSVAERDQAGQQALSDLRSRGLNATANALAQSNDHILAFLTMLRAELAFYIGCLNLRESLVGADEPVCVPVPLPAEKLGFTARGLYDPVLSLRLEGRTVGNDVEADGQRLVMITGANQGGKSTFLRSVGVAQLMMQCGMFVAAESFTASISAGVFTHFKREEDTTMEMGKLDEELSRMRGIAGEISPGCLLLCNESFASTNEQEGSEIARQIIRALLDSGIRVVFVTHLFDLAHGFYAGKADSALFLRPERRENGQRTFRLLPGEPLSTSYGPDLYRRIFGAPEPAAPSRQAGA